MSPFRHGSSPNAATRVGPEGRLIPLAVAGANELAEARRHHLAALAYEAQARGLSCRLTGPGEAVLQVASPVTRRQVMVVATPVGRGWFFLWAGGGSGDAADPGRAADQLARLLG